MELPATQAMDDELPPTQPFVNDEETNDSPVGTLIIDKTSYPILRGLTSIGRHPQCKVSINDATVSANHASIEAEAPNRAIFIKDLGSTNKTKISDTRLRPHSNYQIKDGDTLYFGSVIAKFKLFQPVDDSLISCTPQINRKVRSVIPGTPDSMNASSASEGDMSIIPGTQNDVGTCFRQPEIPSKPETSRISDHSSPSVPAFNMDDFDNSIYSAETQKSSESKPDDTDESIYELETQRPSVETDRNSIENLETQRCDPTMLNSTNNKSHNVSIYSAETQKQTPEKGVNEDTNNIEDLETQRCDPKSLNSTTNESHIVSIYSAETQKQSPEKYLSEDKDNIEDLETQRYDPKLLNNTSIYSAETQKQLPEEDINNSKRKSIDVSIYSAETQKAVSEDDALENLETQQFIVNKAYSTVKKSTGAFIHSAETQKVVPGDNVDESIENMETQRIDTRTSHIFQTPNLPRIKSVKIPLNEMETQKYDPDSLFAKDVSLKDAEIERFECEKPGLEKRNSEKLTPKKQSATEMLQEAETQKYLPDTCNKLSKGDESIDDLETQQFISNIKNVVINESTDNIESQEPDKPTSIEDMDTMPFHNEVPPLDQSNQHVSENLEATNNTNINYQPRTVHSEKIKSSLQDDSSINDQSDTVQSEKDKSSLQHDSSINNIDTSKSAEHDDVEDEMFSQNLIGDCPFAFLPEESQENIDQEIDTCKSSKDLEQENESIVKDNTSNLSVELSKKNNISNDEKLMQSIDDDSETDEEGFFSNPTPTENSTKLNVQKSNSDVETDEEGIFSNPTPIENDTKSNNEKSNSDEETDEEGVFSNHMLKESENSEISVKSKCNGNPETDEGVFSKTSKSNEKLNNEINETDSETDEEGKFSNNLSKTSEVNDKEAKIALKNNKNGSTTGNVTTKMDKDEILDNSLGTTNKTKEENNKSVYEPSKVPSLSFKQNSLIGHSLIPDSDDSLFDDNDDYEKINLNTSEKSNLQADKSDNQLNNTSTSKDNKSTSNQDVKKIDSETNKRSSEIESMNVTKGKNNEVDDLAPTQVFDTSKTVIDESDTEDELLVPTQVISPKKVPTNVDHKNKTNLQVISPKKVPTNINNKEDEDLLEPTQPMEREKSPIKPDSEKFEELVLSPTQKIETQDCAEFLPPTESVKNSPKRETNQIDRNGSIEDLDYEMAPTQPVEDKISKESINSSKRYLDEVEITCNKKLKGNDVRSVDGDSNIEKNLVQMFEGSEEDKVINQGPQLLTQQLEDILQSSQVEEESIENIISSVPSPTLSSKRKNSKTKNRRKAAHLKNTNSSSQEKKVYIDLNDTIERNLKDMFNSSVNDVEPYEPDTLMTQQLANVLESQDNEEVNEEDTKIKVSPKLSTRASRSNSMAPSSSKSKDKRKSNILARSRISPVKEEPKSEKTKESAEESQGTEEYFANLKSKKKRASTFLATQSQEEQTSDSEKQLVYKHGIVGFVDGIGAIRTSKRVALREPKGTPFTSDSQSDSEEPDSSQRQKRFNLSLSKNVDLNSSLSDYDLENTMAKTKSGKEVKQKRVLAKGTRGFKHGSPVECEELVSAPSTEGEEEIGRSQQKVGNLDSSLRLSLDVESETRMSQPVDSDEEFLKSMPDIKVAGTADCPPTSSQLTAPCDDDLDDTISIRSMSIPTKNLLYAQNRFDLIYKKPLAATAKVSSNDERESAGEEKATDSRLKNKNDVPSSDIDEFLAKLGRKRQGDVTPKGTPASGSRSSRAGKRRRDTTSPCTPSSRPGTRSSSNLGVEMMRRNSFAKEANKTLTSSSDSESESGSTYMAKIINKYNPSEKMKNFKREFWALTHGRSAMDDEFDENDLEFARLRDEFERKLSKSNTMKTTARTAAAPRSSPAGTRGSRACALTGGTLSGAGSRTSSTSTTPTTTTTTTRSRAKARIADERVLCLQVPPSAGGADRGARRRPPLAITRSKRQAAEDSQNQPPKRAKTQNNVKLQEVLVVLSPIKDNMLYRSQQVLRTIDSNVTNVFRQNTNEQPKKAEKNLIKFPKPLESYVVLHKTKSKMGNLGSLSRSNDKTLQNKGESEIKSPSRRNKAAVNETTKAETSINKNLSSSKDSVVVEDSDAESSKQISTRGTRSRRNMDTNSSATKNNSKDVSSGNSSEDANKSAKSTRGKAVRQSQKKAAPVKNKTIIPDSDQESDESMSKSKEEKTAHQSDSNKRQDTKRSTSKSSRSTKVKDSDSEKLKDSQTSVNTITRSRRINKATSKIINSQDSDSEFSGEINSISNKNINSKKNVKDKKDSDSERSISPEKNNKSDIPVENKTRSTRRAKAQNSSNSVFSESDSDHSKNSSVANVSKSSRSVRPTRKRVATNAISSESQEEAEFMSTSSEKDTNASKTRKGRTTKKTNASNSSSSQSLKDDSQTDDTSDKSTDRSKRAKVNMSAKNTRSSPSPTPSQGLLTPSRSRRSSLLSPLRGSKHKVLFTGDKSEAHKNIVFKLGATVIDDPGKCTILVTDKVRRTCKFLCCVARGIPIVSFKWLDESLKAQHFVDWEDYILEDPASEAQYKYNLQESLDKARKKQFLEGYTVLFSQIPSNLLSTKELKDIVAASGGKALFRAPAKWPEKIVIITVEDKLQNAKKLIAKASKSITIHTTEFLFTGILRQEVNLQEFKLFS